MVSVIIISSILIAQKIFFGRTPLQKEVVALYDPPDNYRPIDREVRNEMEALSPINLIENNNSNIDLSEVYNLAHELFMEGRYKEAQKIFDSLKSHPILGLQSEWNAVLCDYMHQNHPDTISEGLQAILDDEQHLFHAAALQLEEMLTN